MRMRRRPNLQPRMQQCAAVWVQDAKALQGAWRTKMPGAQQLWVEVGCGKGTFTIETAKKNPDVLVVAIEKVPDALVVAMERAVRENVKNVLFISEDAAQLCEIFAYGEVDRLFLNFCDPWPRAKNAKRRLTYHTFLARYAWILKAGGQLEFKTDNAKLFAFSLEEFSGYGWELTQVTEHLHANGPVGIMTDYEARFYELGTPICRCVASATQRPAEDADLSDPTRRMREEKFGA